MAWRILKRVLLGLILCFALLIVSAASLATWAFYHPAETWDFVQAHVLPADLKISWEKIDFEMRRASFLNFDIGLGFEKLRVTKVEPALSMTIDETHLLASVFLGPGANLVVHEFVAKIPEPVSLTLPPSEKPKEKSERNPFQLAQSSLARLERAQRWVKIESARLQIEKFILVSGDAKTEVSLELSPAEPKAPGVFDFETRVTLPSPATIVAKGKVNLEAIGSPASFIETDLSFEGFGVDTKPSLKLSLSRDEIQSEMRGSFDYRKEKLKIHADPLLRIRVTEDHAEATLQSSFAGLPGPVVKIDRLQAKLQVPFAKNRLFSEAASDFEVQAPVDLYFIDKDMRPPLEKSCQCKIPETLTVTASGKTWLTTWMSKPEKKLPALDVAVKAESVQNKLLSADLAAKLRIEKEGETLFYSPRIDSKVDIHSFQGLRKFLDAKGVLIPAPLDVLDGSLSLTANGPLEQKEKVYEFPVSLAAKLSSARQQVNLTTDALVSLNNTFTEAAIDVKAKIEDLQLELPPLDPLSGLPRVLPDSRLLRKPPEAKKKPAKFKVVFSFEVETARPGAIRLLSKLADPLIPVTVQMKRNSKGENSGFVQTEKFDLVYLRRRVTVEKMRIGFDDPDLDFPIDGRLRINQTQYTIFVDIKGDAKHPSVQLSSDPYLPNSEIISVLLYDRTSEQLISADAETSASFQAALADRAIGLFGLWAFASTPIRSFSYNPVTKVYTATLQLADDLTAGIDTNWDEATQLELRKRVSRRWVLSAVWTPATQDEEEKSKLVLQWENRF